MAATFIRNPYGRFNESANIHSLVFGENAFLTEDELNELQSSLVYKEALFKRTMFSSGVLSGFYVQTGTYDRIIEIQSAKQDLVVSLAGHVFKVGGNKIINQPANLYSQDNKLIVNLESSSTNRTDLVILETWYQSLGIDEVATKFGGEATNLLPEYSIRDPRIAIGTSRRMQFRWRIRTIPNQISITNANAFDYKNQDTGKIYQMIDNDYYEAKVDTPYVDDYDNIVTDGVIRAIPLFLVTRTPNDTKIAQDKIARLITQASLLVDNMPSLIEGDFKFESGNVSITDGKLVLNPGTFEGAGSGIEFERGNALPNMGIKWDENISSLIFEQNLNKILSLSSDSITAHTKLIIEQGAKFKKYEIKYNDALESLDFIFTP